MCDCSCLNVREVHCPYPFHHWHKLSAVFCSASPTLPRHTEWSWATTCNIESILTQWHSFLCICTERGKVCLKLLINSILILEVQSVAIQTREDEGFTSLQDEGCTTTRWGVYSHKMRVYSYNMKVIPHKIREYIPIGWGYVLPQDEGCTLTRWGVYYTMMDVFPKDERCITARWGVYYTMRGVFPEDEECTTTRWGEYC